jgi:hypothetical protein
MARVALGQLAGMDAQLRGRERKDQPAASGIDRRKLERVAQERAVDLRILAVQQQVNAGDRERASRISRHA